MKRKKVIFIKTAAYNYMLKKVASQEVEKGGALLMKDGIIVRFIYDKEATTTSGSYTINTNYLNPLLKKYKKEGEHFCGMLHSHPRGVKYLSGPDQDWFISTIKNFSTLDSLIVPIVFSATDGEYDIFPYIIYEDGTIIEADLQVVPDDFSLDSNEDESTEETENEVKETVVPHQQTHVSVTMPTVSSESSRKSERSDASLLQEVASVLVLPFWLKLILQKGWIMIGLAFLLMVLGLVVALLPTIYECIKFQLQIL